MTYSIRKMLLTDAPAVQEIEARIAQGPWGERLFFDCVSVGYDCWVMVDELDIIFAYAVLSTGANEAHVLNLGVAPEFQGQGNGAKLLQHLIDVAKTQDAYEMFLEVRESNLVARNLYKKFNFVEIGVRKGYYPAEDESPAEDAITLALTLR